MVLYSGGSKENGTRYDTTRRDGIPAKSSLSSQILNMFSKSARGSKFDQRAPPTKLTALVRLLKKGRWSLRRSKDTAGCIHFLRLQHLHSPKETNMPSNVAPTRPPSSA